MHTGLREGGRALSQSRERHRARKSLVVVQVALALVLLICSGLMIRTFRALVQVSPGFTDPNSLQTFRIYIPDTKIPDTQRERVVRMAQAIQDKIAAIPGSPQSLSQRQFRSTERIISILSLPRIAPTKTMNFLPSAGSNLFLRAF